MQNRIKDQFAAGKPAFGTQLRFGSPAIAELCGHSGFDFLVVDSEHVPQTPTDIQAQLQAIGPYAVVKCWVDICTKIKRRGYCEVC